MHQIFMLPSFLDIVQSISISNDGNSTGKASFEGILSGLTGSNDTARGMGPLEGREDLYEPKVREPEHHRDEAPEEVTDSRHEEVTDMAYADDDSGNDNEPDPQSPKENSEDDNNSEEKPEDKNDSDGDTNESADLPAANSSLTEAAVLKITEQTEAPVSTDESQSEGVDVASGIQTDGNSISVESGPGDETTIIQNAAPQVAENPQAEIPVAEIDTKPLKPVVPNELHDGDPNVAAKSDVQQLDNAESALSNDAKQNAGRQVIMEEPAVGLEKETVVQTEISAKSTSIETEVAPSVEKVVDGAPAVKNTVRWDAGDAIRADGGKTIEAQVSLINEDATTNEPNLTEVPREMISSVVLDTNNQSNSNAEMGMNRNTETPKIVESKESFEAVMDGSSEKATEQTRGLAGTSGNRPAAGRFSTVERSVASQIVRGTLTALKSGKSELSLQLMPPELGRVDIRLTLESNIMTARITVASEEVRGMVERQIELLKSAIEEGGARMERFEVLVDGQSGRHQPRSSSGDGERNLAGEDRPIDEGVSGNDPGTDISSNLEKVKLENATVNIVV